jgi:hypothetical protein
MGHHLVVSRLYARARGGEIMMFTGREMPVQSASPVLKFLENSGLLSEAALRREACSRVRAFSGSECSAGVRTRHASKRYVDHHEDATPARRLPGPDERLMKPHQEDNPRGYWKHQLITDPVRKR